MRNRSRLSFFAVFLLLVPFVLFAQREAPRKPRARDLGVPFDGTPGKFNAITDVSGVLVGHTTLVSGEGKLQIGKGPSSGKKFHERRCLRRLVFPKRKW